MTTTQQHPDDEIDLLALIGTLLDYRWLIIGLTAIATILGVAYALLSTPIYQANALLQIEERATGMAGLDLMDDFFQGKSQIPAEIEILKSRMIIGKTVDDLQLHIEAEPQSFPLIGNFIARRFLASEDTPIAPALFGLNSYNWGGALIDIAYLEVPKSLLGSALTLQKISDDSFALFSDQALLLEGKIDEHIDASGIKLHVLSLQGNIGQKFSVSYQDHHATVKQLQKMLQVSEKGKQSGMLSLSLQSSNPQLAQRILEHISSLYVKQNIDRSAAEALNSLDFLRRQLPTVRQEVEEAENKLNQYQITAKSADITIETQSILSQLVKVESELSELRLKQLEMDKLFTSAHPSYQTLNNQIASLEEGKRRLEQRVSSLPEVQQELLRLSRDVGVSSQIYTLLLQKSQELDIARASTVGNVRLIDSALTDSIPVAPRKILIVLIAGLIGGFLSVLIAIVHSLFNRGVETIEEVEALDLSVFAAIPHSDQQIDARGKGNRILLKRIPLLSLEHPTDLSVEAFRSLHTSLHFTIPEAKNNVIMISGPSPKIGKSFISANLATVLAQAGKKVLLIDADMRKGHLHYYFGNHNEVGLSGLLSNQCETEQCIQETQVENLSFISRGANPPNPSELLLTQRFELILQAASKQYDIVIIDTPPILAVSDALAVGKHAGSSFMVVRFGLNPAAEIQAAHKRFADNQITIKGAILNAVKKKSSHRYRYGYQNYQYDYRA